MGTTLFLVRHGETESNRRRAYMGRSDEYLNETGRLQADAVAERLSAFPIVRIITSPIARAVQTAQAIAATVQAPIEKEDCFTEIDFGPWNGLTAKEVEERHPEEARLWRKAPHLLEFPGIETLASVRARVEEGLEKILAKYPGKSIVLVTHDVVIRTLIAIALRIDNNRYREFQMVNASLSVIHFEGTRYRIELLNDTSHLEFLAAG